MGAKATKIEGTYLPDTPTTNRLRVACNDAQQPGTNISTVPCHDALLDPRSPNICRTPINILPVEQPMVQLSEVSGENAFAVFRKRLLKGFALNDPRSPQLNRTPLVLDEAIDRTLNMDDTFADLFVETRAPISEHLKDSGEKHNNSSLEIVSMSYEQDETMACDMILPSQESPPLTQDPRSPSVGVERTPIIFCDDEESEERETQMLEDILETLTLNLSHESSMASFASATDDPVLDNPKGSQSRPANKQLERVRLGNKRRVAPRKPARANKPQIYVDATVDGLTSTPKSNPDGSQFGPRTPLSSVNKNRMHLRSRSVENELFKPKRQLPLQSFDDQLNYEAY